MIDKLYKRIVRFFVETHIARIDFSSEEEAEEFYNWLYPDKSQKRELSMKKIIRICAWTMSVFAVVCLALMLICNQMVVNNAEGKVFADIDSIRYNKVGLLLGTTPQARFDRITNYFFIYRIDAAEQLYKARKIDQILISGDENSLDGVNETECMRDSLVARGVPANAIILDGKGYRTISSVINANKVYGLKSFTIISQKFHNERAIYQAEHLGLDVENIQAYNAKMPTSRRAFLTTIREYFARVKMFIDILTYKVPESSASKTIGSFMGNQIVINNSVYEQISSITESDKMLSYSDSIIQIGDVKWGVNLMPDGIALVTSVQPDDPRMIKVVKYLNSIYEKPYQDDDDGYSIKWSSSVDTLNIFSGTLVHLRRLHTEEGGTILFFN